METISKVFLPVHLHLGMTFLQWSQLMHPFCIISYKVLFPRPSFEIDFSKTNLVVVVKPLGEPNHGNSTKRVSQPKAWASGLASPKTTTLQVTGESQEIVTKVGDFEDQGAVCGV